MNGAVRPQHAMTAPTFVEATDLAVLDNEVLSFASIEPLAQGLLAWTDAQNTTPGPTVPGDMPQVTMLAVASFADGLLLGRRGAA